MAANPFFIDPWAGQSENISRGLQGLGSILGEKRQEKENQVKTQEAQAIFSRGNPQEISQFMIANPEIGARAAAGVQFANQLTEKNLVDSAKRVLSGEDPETVLTERIQMVTQQGGDPSDTIASLEEYRTDPEGFMAGAEQLFAIRDPQAYSAWKKVTERAKPSAKQMGSGDMAGYVFNPDTGSYSIDPNIKQELQAKAKAKKAEAEAKSGVVDAKTRQGINKDVTALTKDTKFIYNAANDLEKLKGSSSAASKLAAVFKFMKALDPTSVVRESEQGQVYSAQGGAAQIAGMLNNLVGEGKLTDAGFADIVNTSKVLAKSAVSASGEELKTYLDTYEDTLPESFKASLISRLPVIEQAPESVDVDVEAVTWAKANPNDPRSVEILRLQGVK